jgi:hypothetical protein
VGRFWGRVSPKENTPFLFSYELLPFPFCFVETDSPESTSVSFAQSLIPCILRISTKTKIAFLIVEGFAGVSVVNSFPVTTHKAKDLAVHINPGVEPIPFGVIRYCVIAIGCWVPPCVPFPAGQPPEVIVVN